MQARTNIVKFARSSCTKIIIITQIPQVLSSGSESLGSALQQRFLGYITLLPPAPPSSPRMKHKEDGSPPAATSGGRAGDEEAAAGAKFHRTFTGLSPDFHPVKRLAKPNLASRIGFDKLRFRRGNGTPTKPKVTG